MGIRKLPWAAQWGQRSALAERYVFSHLSGPHWTFEKTMQEEADALLNQALAETGAPDPRPRYRLLLSELKRQNPSAYDEAVSRFRDVVLPSIARRESEPLTAWLDYGRHLAENLAPGRTLSLDEHGRSSPLTSPASWKDLILHVPADPRARAILVGEPPAPTRAQRATVELLVNGRVMLGSGSGADAP